MKPLESSKALFLCQKLGKLKFKGSEKEHSAIARFKFEFPQNGGKSD